jgi:hypothetical protein
MAACDAITVAAVASITSGIKKAFQTPTEEAF